MNNIILSVMKIKQSAAIRCRQVGIWAALAVLAASSLVLGQTASVQQQPRKPSGTEVAAPSGAAEVASPSGYVDGASTCPGRNGQQECAVFETLFGNVYLGPFKKVGEGVKGVSP